MSHLALLLLMTATTPEATPGKVLVLETTLGEGTDPAAKGLAALLAAEIAKHSTSPVVSADDFAQLTAHVAQRQALGCDADVQCVARASEVAGCDLVVASSVGSVGKSLIVALSLL